nr:unnamed protein product [Callosobruchus chinensis]
MLSYYS